MLPDRVSNPGPLTYESGALPIALRGPATPLEANCSFQGEIPVWKGLCIQGLKQEVTKVASMYKIVEDHEGLVYLNMLSRQ